MALNVETCTKFTKRKDEMSRFQIAKGNGIYYIADAIDCTGNGYPSVVAELDRDTICALAHLSIALREERKDDTNALDI